MPNGDSYVTWDTFREHERDANEGYSRLSTVETKVNTLEEGQHEMKAAIKDLQKTVWQASGMAIGVIALVELFLKFAK